MNRRNRKQGWMRSIFGLLLAVILLLPGFAVPSHAEGWVAWDWGDALEGWDLPEEADLPESLQELSGSDVSGSADEILVSEEETYTSKEEVAAYLHVFGHLPSNYITKKQAKKLGWVSSEGNLSKVAPGKSIGGDYFGNYEELLPIKKGRDYYECDIDYTGGRRGAKRIIYSSDGLIYYTEDHYKTFELLYGEE